MTARVVAVLAVILFGLPAGAQTAAGSIQGQIVDKKTGAPVRFAKLTLVGPFAQNSLTPPRRPGSANPVEMTADEQGSFTFKDVAAGNYAVNVQRDGYVPTRYGYTGTMRQLIAVKPGEPVTGISIPMPPCGVIAGKIVNEKGEPVQNVELVALRYYYGAWMWRQATTPDTPAKMYSNDLGEYRIANLVAGPYIVRAAAPPQTTRNRAAGIAYPSVFYPNALSPQTAEPVTVASGETIRADFALRPGPSFHVSGVIDSGGSDQEVCFGLAPKVYQAALAQVIGRVTRFARDGVFVIDGVPPGSYVLSSAICRGTPALGAIQAVEVAGNVEGLRLQLSAGQQLNGVVKGEGVDVSGVKLALRSPELIPGFVSQAVVGKDGAFVFEHVLPSHHIVDFGNVPAGAYVKSVKYAGRETPASGFEIDGDASLEITLSSQGAAQLTGSVLDKSGSPAPYAMVMVLPAAGGPAESAKDVMTDEKGNFVFPALRPGTYKALAWEARYNPLGIEMADPMLALLFDTNARTVTVNAGTQGSVGLTLNTQDDVNRARVATRMTPPKNQ